MYLFRPSTEQKSFISNRYGTRLPKNYFQCLVIFINIYSLPTKVPYFAFWFDPFVTPTKNRKYVSTGFLFLPLVRMMFKSKPWGSTIVIQNAYQLQNPAWHKKVVRMWTLKSCNTFLLGPFEKTMAPLLVSIPIINNVQKIIACKKKGKK